MDKMEEMLRGRMDGMENKNVETIEKEKIMKRKNDGVK